VGFDHDVPLPHLEKIRAPGFSFADCRQRPHGRPEPPKLYPPLRLLIGVPTLSRADLLERFYSGYQSWLREGDKLLVVNNGGMDLSFLPASPQLEVYRPESNLGVPGS
jgi:hypothetical protein